VFTKVFEEPELYRDKDGIECAYLLPNVDFRLLKLFVLSVLWRASVSRLYFFRDVDLGPHADTIKSLICNGTIEAADDYQFVCSYQRDHPYPKGILPPSSRKIEEINYVQLYLADIQILVKVDKRPLPEFFAPIVIRPKPPHYLVFMPFKGSRESEYFEGMKRALRDHRWPTI
jgi:hypothetical protein